MKAAETNRDPHALALEALVWTLGDEARAARLLALTGLGPDALRRRAGEPALLAAVLIFLENHEADLLACAAVLEVPALALVDARRRLEA